MEQVKQRYGLLTAIAMVVGVVIGSGVFFKADDVLTLTDGNLIYALIAWTIGAISMIFGALVFAEFAQRIQKANGIVDYLEHAYGERVGYLAGWFNGVLYFTPLSAILAWIAALYTMVLLGSDNPSNSLATWVLAFVFLIVAYVFNYLAPVISGKFQVATMIIKLIPLFAIAIVGMITGLYNGVTVDNFAMAASSFGRQNGGLAAAVVATAFAYEGWIVAITINNEIKDAKRNLPRALTFGTIIIFIVYITYFLGIVSVLPTSDIIGQGDNSVSLAAKQLFGSFAGSLLTAFVVISCLGTLNGLALSSSRIPYSLALRGRGPKPEWMVETNPKTGMATNAFIFAGGLAIIYLSLWYASINELFGRYIGLDEIPIVLIYGFYVLLYVWYMKNFKDLGFLKRFVVPALALAGALIILYGGITNPNIGMYMIVSVVILLVGLLFYRTDHQ